MLRQPSLTDAKRGILSLIKRLGPAPAGRIADRLGTTAVAARQHLAALQEQGLVEPSPPARRGTGRGRPAVLWSLTDRAMALFPDEHAELAVGLIEAIRQSVGERGLDKVVERRADGQVELYRSLVPASGSLKKRVEALARQRTAEGYMADVVQERPGVYLLTERHCPICDAARACQGLCRAELRVFRETLGADVLVERTAHLLGDGDRCCYRISRRG